MMPRKGLKAVFRGSTLEALGSTEESRPSRRRGLGPRYVSRLRRDFKRI